MATSRILCSCASSFVPPPPPLLYSSSSSSAAHLLNLNQTLKPLRPPSLLRGLAGSAFRNGDSGSTLQLSIKASCSSGKILEKAQQACEDLSSLLLEDSKATKIVHSIWQRVVKVGDFVVDATCGNGHDTLLLAKLICGEDSSGCVYALDIQEAALNSASLLLDHELNFNQRKQVKLIQICHSKIEEVVNSKPVRLVAFNLGYLPRGNKSLITHSRTTLEALNAAAKCVQPGGLISVIAYVGHPGGREEYDAAKEFFSRLPATNWVCSHFEWLNRPLGPRIFFGSRK